MEWEFRKWSRGFTSVEDCLCLEKLGLDNYLNQSEEKLLKIACRMMWAKFNRICLQVIKMEEPRQKEFLASWKCLGNLHNSCLNTSMTHSPAARVRGFLFLPYFDIICNLLLNRRTAPWNLFVRGSASPGCHPRGAPMSTHILRWQFCLY